MCAVCDAYVCMCVIHVVCMWVMCVVYVLVCACVCICVLCSLYSFETSLSLNLASDQQAPAIPLPHPPQHWDYWHMWPHQTSYMGPGTRTQVLTLVKQLFLPTEPTVWP